MRLPNKKYSWSIYLTQPCSVDENHRLRGDYSTGLTTCIDCEKEALVEAYLRKYSYARCPYCGLAYKKEHVAYVDKDKMILDCECSTIIKMLIHDDREEQR